MLVEVKARHLHTVVIILTDCDDPARLALIMALDPSTILHKHSNEASLVSICNTNYQAHEDLLS